MYDLILRGGTVVDGTRSRPYAADVCIRDGRIARIAPDAGEEAREVVDVSGLTVAPGFIDTDMTRVLLDEQKDHLQAQIPLGRLGSVDDIAQSCLFLASDAGAYITGVTLHVNGGMYMG